MKKPWVRLLGHAFEAGKFALAAKDQFDNADARVVTATNFDSFSRSKIILKSMILDFYQNILGQEGYTTEAAEIFTKAVDKLPALNVVTPRLGEV